MLLKRANWLHAIAVLGILAGLNSCQQAKDAAAEAAGFKLTEDGDLNSLLESAGWDEGNAKFANLEVKAAFEIEDEDKFPIDLGKDEDWKIGFPVPGLEDAASKSGNNKYMLLLKEVEIDMGEAKYTRFLAVTVVEYVDETLKVYGGEFAQYMDEKDRISKDNGNMKGRYIIVQAKGDGGLVGLQGKVTLKYADGSKGEDPVGGAWIITTNSPFIGLSGSAEGKYFLAMLAGEYGEVIAYKKSHDGAPGTPSVASANIAVAGALTEYEDDINGKAEEAGLDSNAVAEEFAAANKEVTEALGGWEVVETNIQFVQPPQAKPAEDPVEETPKPAAPPPEPEQAEPTPANQDVKEEVQENVSRGDETGPQLDLSCTGVAKVDDADQNTLITDGSDETSRGWRFFGDVRITNQEYATIFGTAANTDRFPDEVEGYCLLTTGDGLYQKSGKSAAIYQPKGGKTSEMWQKVKVPSDTKWKSIQMRVTFFTQEYPVYVGTKFNDSFFIKFDEHPDVLASGNLNDLGGLDTPATATNCRSSYGDTTGAKIKAASDKASCGEWIATYHVFGETNQTAALWNIDESSRAPKHSNRVGCVGENKRCYHGMITPRVICKPIPEELVGQEVTLRMSVTDAGDSAFDSALAVDSIAFTTDECSSDAGSTFSGDEAINEKVTD